jgi:hypothetical protein
MSKASAKQKVEQLQEWLVWSQFRAKKEKFTRKPYKKVANKD